MPDPFVLGTPLGRWQTNCYLVGDRDHGLGVLIDPGETAETQAHELLSVAEVECEAILLTHGHLDHLWGVPQLARSLDVPVLLHEEDRWLWDDPAAAFGAPPSMLRDELGLVWEPPSDQLRAIADGDRLRFAGLDLKVTHNPGHTPGHVTYLLADVRAGSLTFPLAEATELSEQVLFSGDLIFAGSIGRTDLPRGSTAQILRSLVDTVVPLDDDTLILAGHGPDTVVGIEREANPFLRQAMEAHAS